MEVPPRQIGRAVGTFAAVQTAAVAFFAAGRRRPRGRDRLAARVSWCRRRSPPACRLSCPPADGRAPRRRAAASRPSSRAGSGCSAPRHSTAYAGVTGVGFLVAVSRRGRLSASRRPSAGSCWRASGSPGCCSAVRPGDGVDRFRSRPGRARRRRVVHSRWLPPSGSRRARGRARGLVWFGNGLGSALLWAGVNVMAVEAVPWQPRGWDVGGLGVQVRRQRRRAADVAAALPRRSGARLPRCGRTRRSSPERSSSRCACHARDVPLASLGDSFSSFFDAVGSFFGNLAAVQWRS